MVKKETSFELLLALAIIARPLIKWLLPGLASVEPIIPLAIIAGILYGAQKGAIVGAAGYIGSNILLMSIGSWTIPQAIGGMIAGILPALFAKKKHSGTDLVLYAVLATVIFEILINIWGGGFEISYFIESISFGMVHIVSNAFFAVLLSGMLPAEKAEKKQENG